jgi:hypothetical protein
MNDHSSKRRILEKGEAKEDIVFFCNKKAF